MVYILHVPSACVESTFLGYWLAPVEFRWCVMGVDGVQVGGVVVSRGGGRRP